MTAVAFLPLETDRLILREIFEEDANEVLALRSDPEIMRFIPRPLIQNEEDALKYIRMLKQSMAKNESINWGITLKNDKKVIGIAGFARIQHENHRAEIGYLIGREHQGKGLMTELLKPIINYGFEVLKLHSIEGIVDPDNYASARILQKHGFVHEAHFKENIFFNGRYMDSVHYTLFKTLK